MANAAIAEPAELKLIGYSQVEPLFVPSLQTGSVLPNLCPSLLIVMRSAQEQLRIHPNNQVRMVRCEYKSGALMLCGLVGSYHLKQLAQETVMGALEGRELSNQITVHR